MAWQSGFSERSSAVQSADMPLKQSFDVLKVCLRVGNIALFVSRCKQSPAVLGHGSVTLGRPRAIAAHSAVLPCCLFDGQ